MKVTAHVTIEYATQVELDQIKAKLPPEVKPVIDLLTKRVTFTVVQEVAQL